MRPIVKKLIDKVYAPLVLFYLKKDRIYNHSGIKLLVKQGVFHPGFFLSTKFLLQAVRQTILLDKTFLELGAGSGLIAFYAAKRGAKVTATDINPIAIEGLEYNKSKLKLPIHIIHSDLFDNIAAQKFDYIIINPPYYPKQANNPSEMAWFCGPAFEYFEKLFCQIGAYMQPQSKVIMSLSEDCNMKQIKEIALKNNLQFQLLKRKRMMMEWNELYLIQPN